LAGFEVTLLPNVRAIGISDKPCLTWSPCIGVDLTGTYYVCASSGSIAITTNTKSSYPEPKDFVKRVKSRCVMNSNQGIELFENIGTVQFGFAFDSIDCAVITE